MLRNLRVVAVSATRLIALDWGTSSLRAYRLVEDGAVAEVRHSPLGILRVPADGGFERAFEEACGDWLRTHAAPVVACGMVGSAQGWREAPYLDVPAGADDLARALTQVETAGGGRLHIVPGLVVRGPLPDVMRGEETQVAGLADGDALVCLPGTHSKWVRAAGGRILHFVTFMTGEVYAALAAHTILGRTMRAPARPDDEAFDRGVAAARSPAGRSGALATIFSTRTLGLTGQLSADAQADYLSGVLVGHEVAAMAPGAAGPVVLAGAEDLCRRYRRALAAFGLGATVAPDASARGLWRVAVSAGLVR